MRGLMLHADGSIRAAQYLSFPLALQFVSMFGVDVLRSAKKPLTGRRSAQLSVFAPDSDIIAPASGDRFVPLYERSPRPTAGTSVAADIYSGSRPYEIWAF